MASMEGGADQAAREPGGGETPEPAVTGAGAVAAGAGPARDGMVDLFGLLAYAELVAFFRLTEDATLAPSLAEKAALAEMAVAEFGHFAKLHSQLSQMSVVPEQAMLPFVAPLDAFHARTAPADWLEGLVKAYVGDGLAADFYRAVAQLLEPSACALVTEVLSDTGHAEFVIPRVRAAIDGDPAVGGRLALWARRLVGEGLAQAHRVVAERPPLARLLARMASGAEGSGQGEIGRMFARLTDAHDERMGRLGLADWERGEA
jgi:tRNA-(MS[2]IO[6]A)-hydroxylase MiaE-like protein